MAKKIYVTCEKNTAGVADRQRLAHALQSAGFTYELLPVSRRLSGEMPAISPRLVTKAAWIGFSSADAVQIFFEIFATDAVSEAKIAARDLPAALKLKNCGIVADFVPVMPLHLKFDWRLPKPSGLVLAVDGHEWPGFKAHCNLVLTRRQSLLQPIVGPAVFLVNSAREAAFLLKSEPRQGVFLCRNAETAEVFWRQGITDVVLPDEFTLDGMVGTLSEIC